jgi:redox-sensing transcriptional repressor
MRGAKIPHETIRRLPLYWRAVNFISAENHAHINSKVLADVVHINPWQIRKDLSYFGTFGTRDIGYDTKKLLQKISDILRLNINQKAILVGVGNLGMALLKYSRFKSYRLDIVAAFEKQRQKIGKTINGVIVEDVSKLNELKGRGYYIGIIAVPAVAAQDILKRLVYSGVYGILNFAPVVLEAPKNVTIINIDIALGLARMPYHMSVKQMEKR